MTNRQLGNLFVRTSRGNACVKCGSDTDFLATFSKYQICGKCTRKAYKRIVKA